MGRCCNQYVHLFFLTCGAILKLCVSLGALFTYALSCLVISLFENAGDRAMIFRCMIFFLRTLRAWPSVQTRNFPRLCCTYQKPLFACICVVAQLEKNNLEWFSFDGTGFGKCMHTLLLARPSWPSGSPSEGLYHLSA